MSDLIKLLDAIRNPEVSHTDMAKRRAKGTSQWFLERKPDCDTHPVHDNNVLEFLVCGQEGFSRIQSDILRASSTVDLVLWGFDPAMELVRSGHHWPRGITYGDLLANKAAEGVQVRMLMWFSGRLRNNVMTGNAPDFPWEWSPVSLGGSGLRAPRADPGVSRAKRLEMRSQYARDWWMVALSGGFPNLEVRLRAGHPWDIQSNLTRHLPNGKRDLAETGGMLALGTHHQKPVLIDYEPSPDTRKKPNTCAYVMGLNSVTDYWDSETHTYNDPRREVSPKGSGATSAWHLKPYRDYAIRVRGEALFSINENFVQGWDSADGASHFLPVIGAYTTNAGAGWFGKKLAAQRAHIRPADIPIDEGESCQMRSRVQILRTQPEKQDGTILKAYTLAASNAVNYIYVENQYFQLAEWAEFVKEMRTRYRQAMKAAGAAPSDIAPLHLFIVIPQPERDEMVPATYETLSQIGQGQGMGRYDAQVQGRRKDQSQSPLQAPVRPAEFSSRQAFEDHNKAVDEYRAQLQARQQERASHGGALVRESVRRTGANPQAELDGLGIKVLAAMLLSHDGGNEARRIRINERDSRAQTARAEQEAKVNNGKADDVDAAAKGAFNVVPGRYREIYIHSKLMFVDDVFTTLGSANLNARSMAADSELNLATESYGFTQQARRRVWGNLAGTDLDGGACSPEETKQVHGDWLQRMNNNRSNRKSPQPSAPENNSFIHPFEDPRGEPAVRLA